MASTPYRSAPWHRRIFHHIVGWIAIGVLRLLRLTNRKTMSNALGRLMRKLGPWIGEHKIGRANLAAAFPEKSAAEIEAILLGVWENLGRNAAEFPHLDRLTISDFRQGGNADIMCFAETGDRIAATLASGKPTVVFCAHLGNWETLAVIPVFYKVDVSILYRPPNIENLNDAILKIRSGRIATFVPGGPDAPRRLARVLAAGGRVAMLADQHYGKGPEVMFFGRPCKANPMLARLARKFDCEVRGLRTIRQPDGNSFLGELTEPIAVPRDESGRIDVQGTMQAIMSVIEGWVREHPEQWLWLHRRWR